MKRKMIRRIGVAAAGTVLSCGMLFTSLPEMMGAAEGLSTVRAETLYGFQTFNGVTYYYVNGQKQYTLYKAPNGKKYYFNESTGAQETGFITYGGRTYYFNPSSTPEGRYAVSNIQQKIDGAYYYFDTNGVMQTEKWLTSGSVKCYFGSDGKRASGFAWIDGKCYYFTPATGAMVTGKQTINGESYVFDSNGVKISGKDPTGSGSGSGSSSTAKKGWVKSSGKWYYYDAKGNMKKGWLKLGGKWYFLNKSGVMQTGWKQIDKKWYFFKKSGAMASNEYCGGYFLNANGSWTYKPKASWKKDKTGWYYIDTKGWYAKNKTYTIDGKKYSFNAKGYLK